MSLEIADLVAVLRADMSSFDRGIARADARLRSFHGVAGAAFKAIAALGISAMAGATGGLVASIKTAIDFQTQWNELLGNTTLNMTNSTQQIDAARSSLLKLATQTNAPISELIDGLRHAVNYGFSLGEAMQIVKVGMMSATSTGGDTGKVTESLANVMHEYSMSAADAGKAMDVLHLAAAQGNMTLDQFVNVSGKAISMAANLGVPLTDVGAAYAALTRHGISAAQTSTLIAGALSKILNPAVGTEKQLLAVSRASGVDLYDDFTKAGLASKGLMGVLSDLALASERTGVNVFKLIPATRGGLAAMILTGTGTKDYRDILLSLNDVMAGKIHPTLDAYRRTQQTVGFEMGLLRNNVEVLGITIGTILLPPVIKLVQWITTVVQDFTHWVQTNPLVQAGLKLIGQGVTALIGFLKTLGPKIQDIVKTIADWVGGVKKYLDQHPVLVKDLKELAKDFAIFAAGGAAYEAVKVFIKLLGGFIAFFLPKSGLGYLVGLFAVAWVNDWGNIREHTQQVWTVLKPILEAIAKFLNTPLGTNLALGILSVAAAVFVLVGAMRALAAVKGALAGLKGLFDWFTGKGGSSQPKGIDGLTKAIDELTKAVTTYFPPLTKAITTTLQATMQAAGLKMDKLAAAIAANFQALAGVINKQFPTLANAVTTLVKKLPWAITGLGPLQKALDALNNTSLPNLTTAVNALTAAIQGWKPGPGPGPGTGGGKGGPTPPPTGPAGPTISGPALQAIQALTNAINTKVVSLTNAIAGKFPSLFNAINNKFPGLTGAITNQFPKLTSLTNAINTKVAAMTNAVATWFPKLIDALGKAPVTGGGTVKFTGGASLQKAIADLQRAIVGNFPGLTRAIFTWFPELINALRAGIKISGPTQGVNILDWIKGLGKTILIHFGVAASELKRLANAIDGFFGPAGDMGKAVASGVARIRDAFNGVWGGIGSDAARGIRDVLGGAMKGALGQLATTIGNIVGAASGAGSLWQAMTGWVNSAAAQVARSLMARGTGIKDQIFSVFNGAETWLYDIGVSIMRGLWNGMSDEIQKLGAWLKGLGGWIQSHKGPPSYDRTILVGNGQLIMQGLMTGMQSQMGALGATLTGVTSAIAAFGARGPRLGAAGARGAGRGGQPVKVAVFLDGKQIYDAMQPYAYADQRMRTGMVSR